MSQSTRKLSPGDAVIVSDSAMIYSGVEILERSDARVGIVLDIKNARSELDLDNDENLVATLLPDGSVEWIWELDLDFLN